MKFPSLLRTALVFIVVVATGFAAPTPREIFLAAKQTATDANFRNDQAGLRAALAQFSALENDSALGNRARYHAAWTEWMIAASFFQDKKPADAVAVLDSGCARLRHVLADQSDDGEAHGLLAWMLMAIVSGDRARVPEVIPQVREHRQRALELAPKSPRVVMLDATMMFYSPQPGVQEKGLARWQETLDLVAAEKIDDPTLPDWGRTLADGWLSNLYLFTKPARIDDARAHAEKALRERPDWWWVAHEVLPKTQQP